MDFAVLLQNNEYRKVNIDYVNTNHEKRQKKAVERFLRRMDVDESFLGKLLGRKKLLSRESIAVRLLDSGLFKNLEEALEETDFLSARREFLPYRFEGVVHTLHYTFRKYKNNTNKIVYCLEYAEPLMDPGAEIPYVY